ncbi:extracellular tyrosine-protein kinase PKDCC [Aplochiton taeniatus]
MPAMGNPLCAALIAFVVMSLLITLLINKWNFGAKGYNSTLLDENLSLRRSALIHELNERRKELLPFFISTDDERLLDESGYFSQQHKSFKTNVLDFIIESGMPLESTGPYEIGCDSLVDMRAVDILGSGYTKLVLKVVLSEGQPVALKFVNDQGFDMRKCLEDFNEPLGCHELVSYKLKKEIALLQRLQHQNIIELKGHCVEDTGGGRGWEDAQRRGGGRVTAILEQGAPLQMIQLLQSPWEERFRVCLGLVRLLHYLSQSPLGSVALLDFQPRQFVLVSGELKLTDLDDASAKEPVCQTDADCALQFPLRNFSVPCSAQGVCDGLNERRNLYNAYRYFFTYLLPHQAPPALKHLVDRIMNSTGELSANVNNTLEAFEQVLHVYKSGLHLDRLPPSLLRDYTVMRGMGTSGNGEYRCWPSYSLQGCVLSVQSAREAALMCNSHSQCTSFSLTGQRTWTGRLLASFRTSFSHLVPDGDSEVYLRKTKASGVSSV